MEYKIIEKLKSLKLSTKNIIIRENIKEAKNIYLVYYKSSLDDYSKTFKVVMSEKEKDYIQKLGTDKKIIKLF